MLVLLLPHPPPLTPLFLPPVIFCPNLRGRRIVTNLTQFLNPSFEDQKRTHFPPSWPSALVKGHAHLLFWIHVLHSHLRQVYLLDSSPRVFSLHSTGQVHQVYSRQQKQSPKIHVHVFVQPQSCELIVLLKGRYASCLKRVNPRLTFPLTHRILWKMLQNREHFVASIILKKPWRLISSEIFRQSWMGRIAVSSPISINPLRATSFLCTP